nr:DUF3383 family protein [Bdellovibrio sp. HAGR004]
MSLDQIVNIQITLGSKSVTRAGFGTPLVLGPNGDFGSDLVRTYTSLPGVAEDFETTDDEYKWAQRLFSQEKKPRQIRIGKRAVKVAQIETLTPTVANTTAYKVTINGEDYEFTSDADATATEIVAGLIALINADPLCKMSGSGTTTLILTAENPGEANSVSASSNLAIVHTTANHGVIEDIQALQQVNDDWYCLILTSRDDLEILQAAAYIEALRKIFIAASDGLSIKTASTTDLGSVLKQKTYNRTALLWSGDEASGPEAAWAGRKLPTDPGSEQWRYASLSGISTDVLNATELANLNAKNVNHYTTVGGVGIVQKGKMASGQWIDVTRFLDWFTARVQEGIYGLLVSVEKVPYTDGGVTSLEAIVRAKIEEGIRVGGISRDDGYTVESQKVAEVDPQLRQDRIFPDIAFEFRLAGAIGEVTVKGFVSV